MRLFRWAEVSEFNTVVVYNMDGIPYQIWFEFDGRRFALVTSRPVIDNFHIIREMITRFKMGVEGL